MIFRPEAEADVADAFAWYEEQSRGLGSHFLLCMEAALSQIKRHPDASPVVHRQIRRALLRRFPYGVFLSSRRHANRGTRGFSRQAQPGPLEKAALNLSGDYRRNNAETLSKVGDFGGRCR